MTSYRNSIILCFTVFAIAIGTYSVPVMAQEGVPQRECSDRDLRKIDAFDLKMKRKRQERDKIQKKVKYTKSMSQAMKYERKMKELKEFFKSVEYMAMQPFYERCHISMPSL